jgi:hypothetical protein
MEIFIIVDNIEYQLSVFQDENIEITKSWNEQQIISGYGSWSKTFQVPCDHNNDNIFKYYNIIGASKNGYKMNPNFFYKARIIIEHTEIIGNIQIMGFKIKNGEYHSYELTFYGEEKNLINYLNKSVCPKISQAANIGSFLINVDTIEATWAANNPDFFVPLMATKRPFVYRSLNEENYNENPNNIAALSDINGAILTSGVTLNDLGIAYNFSKMLDNLFISNGLTHLKSTNVTEFLDNLYLMNNSNYTSTLVGDITAIQTKAFSNNSILVNRLYQNVLNISERLDSGNGYLSENTDFT